MSLRTAMLLALATLLAACSGPDEDLAAWMADAEKGLKPAAAPLPTIEATPAFAFDPATLADPFQPRGAARASQPKK